MINGTMCEGPDDDDNDMATRRKISAFTERTCEGGDDLKGTTEGDNGNGERWIKWLGAIVIDRKE